MASYKNQIAALFILFSLLICQVKNNYYDINIEYHIVISEKKCLQRDIFSYTNNIIIKVLLLIIQQIRSIIKFPNYVEFTHTNQYLNKE